MHRIMISKEIIYIGLVSAVRFKQLSDLCIMHTRIVIEVETVTRKFCTDIKEQTTGTRSLENLIQERGGSVVV